MRKFALISIILIITSFMLISCTSISNNKESKNEATGNDELFLEVDNETMNSSLTESEKTKIKDFETTSLTLTKKDILVGDQIFEEIELFGLNDYELMDISLLDNNKMVVYLDNSLDEFKRKLESKILIISVQSNEIKEIYHGEYLGGSDIVQFRRNDDLLIIDSLIGVFFIDINTEQIVDSYMYDKYILQANVNRDGDKIAYTTEEGLFVDTVPSGTPNLIMKSVDDSNDLIIPTEPRWSDDGDYLSYATGGNVPFTYHFLNKEYIETWSYSFESSGYSWWIDDSNEFIGISLGELFDQIPYAYKLNVDEKEAVAIELEGFPTIRSKPNNSNIVYELLNMSDYSHELVFLDFENMIFQSISPSFFSLDSYSVLGKDSIAFIGVHKENEKRMIFIKTKLFEKK